MYKNALSALPLMLAVASPVWVATDKTPQEVLHA